MNTDCRRLSDWFVLVIAFRHGNGRPFYLVLDPVLMRWFYHFGLIDDARLHPRKFRLGGMQCKNRRTTGSAKTPDNLSAIATDVFVAPNFRRRLNLQIFQVNPNADVEGASVRPAAILAMAIVRRANDAGIAQCDSTAQARGFKMPAHNIGFKPD